jgi:hypothetical protein
VIVTGKSIKKRGGLCWEAEEEEAATAVLVCIGCVTWGPEQQPAGGRSPGFSANGRQQCQRRPCQCAGSPLQRPRRQQNESK